MTGKTCSQIGCRKKIRYEVNAILDRTKIGLLDIQTGEICDLPSTMLDLFLPMGFCEEHAKERQEIFDKNKVYGLKIGLVKCE